MTVDDDINQLERALALDPDCREHAERLFHLYERQGRLFHFESQAVIEKAARYGAHLAKPISKWRKDLKSESLPDRYDAVRSLTKLGMALTPLLPELVDAFNVKHSELRYRVAFYEAFAGIRPHFHVFLPLVVENISDLSRSEDARIAFLKIFRNAGPAVEPLLLQLAKSEKRYSQIEATRLFGTLGLKSPAVLEFLENATSGSDDQLCWAALISLRQLNEEWSRLCPIAVSILENMTFLVVRSSAINLFKELGAEAWPAVRVILKRIDGCPRFIRRRVAEDLRQIDFGSSENNERFQSFCAAELSR
ncbi:MAG: hypothetical protein P1V97_06145 [Planctomycetota bacterium]|nr:hypothetical protein [Planctomycetota bacterium]